MSLWDAADNGVNTPYIETVGPERRGKALLVTEREIRLICQGSANI